MDVHLLTQQGDRLVVQVVDGQVIVPAPPAEPGALLDQSALDKLAQN